MIGWKIATRKAICKSVIPGGAIWESTQSIKNEKRKGRKLPMPPTLQIPQFFFPLLRQKKKTLHL